MAWAFVSLGKGRSPPQAIWIQGLSLTDLACRQRRLD